VVKPTHGVHLGWPWYGLGDPEGSVNELVSSREPSDLLQVPRPFALSRTFLAFEPWRGGRIDKRLKIPLGRPDPKTIENVSMFIDQRGIP